MKKIVIAIDGFSSTGKSTVARRLAKELGYIYVDTGAMYRTVTFFAIKNKMINGNQIDKQNLISKLEDIRISFKFNPELKFAEVYLNGENIEASIRTLEVSQHVSYIAEISEVRRKLVQQQQLMGKEKGVVMDGRDIATVVFPEAELKIFMTASAETRAKRRYKELLERGDDINYEEVLVNVVTRDEIDSTREDSPLVKAEDSIEFDNSTMTIDEQLNAIRKLVEDIL